jgi:toxin CcdB
MARFDVYAKPYAPERSHTPFVLDIQHEHLGALLTHVMIPLPMAKGFATQSRGLNPLIDLLGKAVVLDTAALAPVPTALLSKPVARADAWRDDVQDALETLFGAC